MSRKTRKEKKTKKATFDSPVAKMMVSGALATVGGLISEENLKETEEFGIKAIKKYFEENQGDYFAIVPVSKDDKELHLILFILKENEEGILQVIKQQPFNFEDIEVQSLHVRQLIRDIFNGKIDIFNFLQYFTQKKSDND